MQLAYHLATDNAFLEHNVSISSAVNTDMSYLSDCVIDALVQSNISQSGSLGSMQICQCQWPDVSLSHVLLQILTVTTILLSLIVLTTLSYNK